MHRLILEKRTDIAALCRRHRIRHLQIFGSAARGEDFEPTCSDADFLVEFAPDAHAGLKELLEIEQELRGILGREVDLVERKVIEESQNYIRRRHILDHAETVYVA